MQTTQKPHSQWPYIHLEKYNDTTPTETKTLFQQMIGTLIYPAIGTRPDIAFAATQLSRYNNNPSDLHVKHAKHALRYLRGTKGLHIKYDGSSNTGLIRYSDSDWGENKDDHHSTSFHIFLMPNGCISWASQWQKTIALSVREAKYMELASTRRLAAWLKSISIEVDFPIHGPIPLCVDNQAVIFLMVNPAVERWTKHIDIWHHYHYIREQYKNKVIEPFHVAGIENPADTSGISTWKSFFYYIFYVNELVLPKKWI